MKLILALRIPSAPPEILRDAGFLVTVMSSAM